MNRGKAGYFLIQFFENQKFKYRVVHFDFVYKKMFIKKIQSTKYQKPINILNNRNKSVHLHKQILVFLSYTIDIIIFKRI